jgi:hypothetical protein
MKILVKAKARAKVERVERVGQAGFDFGDYDGGHDDRGSDHPDHSEDAHEMVTYKVSVKEAPVDGRANDAIIRALAEYFDVAKSSVKLLSGHTSKQKIFEIGI